MPEEGTEEAGTEEAAGAEAAAAEAALAAEAAESESGSEAAAETVDFNSFEAFSKLRAGLTDEKLQKNMERFQSFEDVAKSNQEARQQIAKAITPINADSKPSEIEAYRKALGVPTTVDEYEVPIPDGMDEAVFKTEEMQAELKNYATIAHNNNIPKAAFSDFLTQVFADIGAKDQSLADADTRFATESEAALKSKWGAQYGAEVELGNRGLEFSFADNLEAIKGLKTADDKMISDHPIFIEAMNKVGRAVSEDSVSSFPVDAVAEQGLRAQLEKLTVDQADAQVRGEYQKAQAIDLEIMEVARKISGDNKIVGA